MFWDTIAGPVKSRKNLQFQMCFWLLKILLWTHLSAYFRWRKPLAWMQEKPPHFCTFQSSVSDWSLTPMISQGLTTFYRKNEVSIPATCSIFSNTSTTHLVYQPRHFGVQCLWVLLWALGKYQPLSPSTILHTVPEYSIESTPFP